jgi:predicted metal-dependent hydrolase
MLGAELRYSLRISAKAKQVRVVIRAHDIELVVPNFIRPDKAIAFLEAHQHKVLERQRSLQRRINLQDRAELGGYSLAHGSELDFQNRRVVLNVSHDAERVKFLECNLDSLSLAVRASSSDSYRTQLEIREGLQFFIKSWMPKAIEPVIERFALRSGVRPRSLRIKSMTTRWGSCGPGGDINLNWSLAFSPETVLHYVVVHELCHLLHRNHSKSFWDSVTHHHPTWRHDRQWLKLQGGALLQRFCA